MKRHDRITILRNRHRVRDLRAFRDLVVMYFEQVEYDDDGLPIDWDSIQSLRSHINQRLPRITQIVHAAGLADSSAQTTAPGLGVSADVLRDIFSSRIAGDGGQELIDVLDMAIGVYDAGRFAALFRTVNPFHYAATLIGFVAGLPGRLVRSLGFGGRRAGRPLSGEEVARLEARISRLADSLEAIERRAADSRDRQTRQLAETAEQVAELAERLDFAERVLAQQPPVKRLEAPDSEDVATPV